MDSEVNPRGLRDPEAIGERILALRGEVGGSASSRADIVMRQKDLPVYRTDASTVTETMETYRSELIEEALKRIPTALATLQRLHFDSFEIAACGKSSSAIPHGAHLFVTVNRSILACLGK